MGVIHPMTLLLFEQHKSEIQQSQNGVDWIFDDVDLFFLVVKIFFELFCIKCNNFFLAQATRGLKELLVVVIFVIFKMTPIEVH